MYTPGDLPPTYANPLRAALLLMVGLLLSLTRATALAQTNGPACTTYTNRTTANGLGDNFVYGVYAEGTTVYAATGRGLSISTDGGISFTNYTTTDGLGSITVNNLPPEVRRCSG